MANKIYIDWDRLEYYIGMEEVKRAFLNYVDYTDFSEFLDSRYSTETIFNFTEEEKAEILSDYNSYLEPEMENWIMRNLTTIDVDVILKEV